MTPCPHGEPDRLACIECLSGPPIHVAPNRPKPVGMSPAFAARYPGRCDYCDESFDEGDSIVRLDPSGYAHVECAR